MQRWENETPRESPWNGVAEYDPAFVDHANGYSGAEFHHSGNDAWSRANDNNSSG